MNDAPIFIVGSARSGTCFLGGVLKRHKDIHCLIERPETFNYATYLAMNPNVKVTNREHIKQSLKEIYLNAWRYDRWSCRSCSRICKREGNVGRMPWKNCHSNKSYSRYADKSHQHVLNIDVLIEVFPRAQFIHLIRDARDVVASMLKHPGVLNWFNNNSVNKNSIMPSTWFGITDKQHYEEWENWSLEKRCALRWLSWFHEAEHISNDMSDLQWYSVKYEDLVQFPEKALEDLFNFIGLEPIPKSMIKARSTSVGKWKYQLNNSQLDDILSISETALQKLGYQTT